MVKLLFVVFGRLSYSFFMNVKSNFSVHAVYRNLWFIKGEFAKKDSEFEVIA